jgi:5-deoxy-glucuronate isomerase
MAGPADERAWRFCDDPAHAWIRGTWRDQAIDPRLPLTSTTQTSTTQTSTTQTPAKES